MTTEQKREAIRAAYPGRKWAQKVNAMTEDQVVAVYLRLKQQNKI